MGTTNHGFYANLLSYRRVACPGLTNRDVGTLLARIDPWLAATIDTSTPQNIFKKVKRISSKKRDKDALVVYTLKHDSGKKSHEYNTLGSLY